MMKIFTKRFLVGLLLIVCTSSVLNAQVGIGTTSPNSSAVLDVSSTKKGFLPPRLTSQARDSIVLPANGLTVWCTNCANSGELDIYNGAQWQTVTGDTAAIGPSPYSLSIGDSFLGGVLAYVFQPGDSGYVSGEIHGIVATPADVGVLRSGTTVEIYSQDSTLHPWELSASGNTVFTGAADTAVGQGGQNTVNIIRALGVGNYAAYICKYYNVGNAVGWYLPDENEMLKLYAKKGKIGGFVNQQYNSSTKTWGLASGGAAYGYYWTSTAAFISGNEESTYADVIALSNGQIYSTSSRTSLNYIRPIKRF